MPKKTARRIIDSRTGNRSTTISGVTLSAPAPGVTDHGVLLGLADDDHTQYLLADGTRSLSGNLSVDASVTIDGVDISAHAANASAHHAPVTAGTLIALSGQQVGIATGATYQFIGTGSGTAAAWQNLSTLAGNGLTHSAGVLAVGAGTLVAVAEDGVGLAAGAAYQFVGTGGDTTPEWRNVSELAGNGLTATNGVLALTTPGTLTASTTNSASGNHTHAVTTGAASTLTVSTSNASGSSASLARADHLHTITTSSNPGATASILATSAAGGLQLVQLASNATFASGFAGSGYRVDYGVTEASKASAEFDNLTVRGRMRVYELLIQQVRATNGSVFVSSSSKVQTVTTSANPLWTVNGSQLTFNGVNATFASTLYTITTSTATEAGADRTHYHGFLVGDIIRAQQLEWNGSGFAGIIQSDLEVTGVTNLYTYQAALVSGDAPAVGYDYVRIGSASDTTRQGSIYLSSDDSNAPFIDIVDTVRSHADWNTTGKVKARVGKLTGITDAYFGALSGYGLYSDNVYLRGSIYATDGVFRGTVYAEGGMFNGTVYATDGSFTGTVTATAGSIAGVLTIGTSGEIRQGTGTLGTDYTGLRMWLDSGIGRIGGYNANTLQWYAGTDGKLYAGGGNVVADSAGLSVVGSATLKIKQDASTTKGYIYSSNPLDSLLSNTTGIGMVTTGTSGAETISLLAKAALGRRSELVVEAGGTAATNRIRAHAYSGGSENSTLEISETQFSIIVGGTTENFNVSPDRTFIANYIDMEEMTAPSAPSANNARLYLDDNGSGKTRLMVRFSSGSAVQLAIQP